MVQQRDVIKSVKRALSEFDAQQRTDVDAMSVDGCGSSGDDEDDVCSVRWNTMLYRVSLEILLSVLRAALLDGQGKREGAHRLLTKQLHRYEAADVMSTQPVHHAAHDHAADDDRSSSSSSSMSAGERCLTAPFAVKFGLLGDLYSYRSYVYPTLDEDDDLTAQDEQSILACHEDVHSSINHWYLYGAYMTEFNKGICASKPLDYPNDVHDTFKHREDDLIFRSDAGTTIHISFSHVVIRCSIISFDLCCTIVVTCVDV